MLAGSAAKISGELLTEVESEITRLNGVLAAKCVTSAAGGFSEIHLLHQGKRPAKYVAQDVQSLLEARWNLAVDKRIISVAQMGTEEKKPKPLRLQIMGVETKRNGVTSEIAVELGTDKTVQRGTASGPETPSNRMRLVANASLDALTRFLPAGHSLLLEATSIEKVGRREVAVVCITLITPDHEETLMGTCAINRDLVLSTVKATLDALNRRLGKLAVV